MGKNNYRFVKRITDITMSVILLILLLPLILLFTIIVIVETGGFPFFFQRRAIYFESKQIKIIKFRTIINDDESCVKLNKSQNVQSRRKDGLIIGSAGSFLRKTCLDELPQLINVLKG